MSVLKRGCQVAALIGLCYVLAVAVPEDHEHTPTLSDHVVQKVALAEEAHAEKGAEEKKGAEAETVHAHVHAHKEHGEHGEHGHGEHGHGEHGHGEHGHGGHGHGHGHVDPAKLLKKYEYLREEFEHTRHLVVHVLGGSSRMANCLVGVIAFVVVLSLLFEGGSERLRSVTPESLHGVLATVYQELTVLGFISLFAFVAIKTGIPLRMSVAIFGTESELHHIFHLVHLTVFLFMSVFLGLFGGMLVATRVYKSACIAADEQITQNPEKVKTDYFKWFEKAVPTIDIDGYKQRAQDVFHMQLLMARGRFMTEILSSKRFEIKDGRNSNFSFGDYMAVCTDHTLNEVIELRPVTWFCLLMLLFPLRAFMMLESMDTRLGIFTSLGILLLIFALVIEKKLEQITHELLGCPYPTGNNTMKESTFAEEFLGTSGGDPSKYKPPYLHQPAISMKGTKLTDFNHRIFHGVGIPNKHQQLFWGMGLGKDFAFHAVRSVVFFTAIYITAFLIRFSSFMIARHWIIVVVALLAPTYMFLVLFPQLLMHLNLVTSIGQMKNYHSIRHVLMVHQTAQLLSAIKLLDNMRLSMAKNLKKSGKQSKLIPELSSDDREEAQLMFEAYDFDGSGTLDAGELTEMLTSLGYSSQDIKEHVDKTWNLDFDDTLVLLGDLSAGKTATSQSDVKEIVDHVFSMVDTDASGRITSSELLNCLRKGGQQIDEKAIELTLQEADTDGDGEVDKKELATLLTRYTMGGMI